MSASQSHQRHNSKSRALLNAPKLTPFSREIVFRHKHLFPELQKVCERLSTGSRTITPFCTTSRIHLHFPTECRRTACGTRYGGVLTSAIETATRLHPEVGTGGGGGFCQYGGGAGGGWGVGLGLRRRWRRGLSRGRRRRRRAATIHEGEFRT